MALPWLFLLHLASLLMLCTENTTKGFGTTDTVMTLGNHTEYTETHYYRSSTQDNGKLVNANNATRQLIVTEAAQNMLKEDRTTVSICGSQNVAFPSAQRMYDKAILSDQINSRGRNPLINTDKSPLEDNETDLCIMNKIQQHGLEAENQTTFTTTICKSGSTDFECQLASSDLIATVRFVTEDVVTPIIAFPGCVFNIISVYVLVKQGTESSSTRYLIALGVADLCYLTSTLFAWILILLKKYQYALYVSTRLFLIYASLKTYFLLLTGRYSNLLVLLLSLDRFIAVKFPLKAKTSPLSRHPIKFALALFVFLSVLLIPNFCRSEFLQMTQFDANKSELVSENTSFSNSKPQFFTIHTFVTAATFRFSPVLFTLVLNIAIILVVKFSNDFRVTTQMTDENRQQRELKITRMLVTISLIFLTCVTPGLLHVIMANFYPAYSSIGTYRNIYLVLSYMFPILDTINSTVNFFVYVLLSKRFRTVFLETFCHTCIK